MQCDALRLHSVRAVHFVVPDEQSHARVGASAHSCSSHLITAQCTTVDAGMRRHGAPRAAMTGTSFGSEAVRMRDRLRLSLEWKKDRLIRIPYGAVCAPQAKEWKWTIEWLAVANKY